MTAANTLRAVALGAAITLATQLGFGVAAAAPGPNRPPAGDSPSGVFGPLIVDDETGQLPTLSLPGAPGPQGVRGPAGATGATGPAGSAGPVGPAGPQGEQGLQGVAGATGATGPAGHIGPQGPQGIQGLAGLNGADGATGPTGPVEPAVPAGPVGPQGPAGVSGLTGTTVITATTNAVPANNALATATATCPAGRIAIAGGGMVTIANPNNSDVSSQGSAPVGTAPPTGWTATAVQARAGGTAWSITAYVVCGP